ncbi:hypothetical protein KFE25_001275 [Diacronema lutheri]|uniref:Uncharacterized protein n=1 Tax=Diacronema lutheri TaxID=2081491 RepID=A0A8J5XIC7_DIALT|nr:hypothetical protein KFE25_001275 [Diacronema lutheri]
MPPKFRNVGAYDAVRAMMDSLMGEDRDVPPDQRDSVKRRELGDDDVDRFYLCGCSPYVVLAQTKSESMLPRVDALLVQDERLKAEWDALPQGEKDRYGFEHETLNFLQDMVDEMDRRIAATKARLDASNEPAEPDMTPEVAQQVQALKDQILELQVKAELAGEQGEVEASVALSAQADALGARKAELQEAAEVRRAQSAARRQVVCAVSGLIYAANDSDARIAELQSGRQYRGWKAMRERLQQLRAQAPRPGAPRFSRRAGFSRVERERDERAGGRPYEPRAREYGGGSRSRERDERAGAADGSGRYGRAHEPERARAGRAYGEARGYTDERGYAGPRGYEREREYGRGYERGERGYERGGRGYERGERGGYDERGRGAYPVGARGYRRD